MSETQWIIRFGKQENAEEYYCWVYEPGDDIPVDTFYHKTPKELFEDVSWLLESELTGLGL